MDLGRQSIVSRLIAFLLLHYWLVNECQISDDFLILIFFRAVYLLDWFDFRGQFGHVTDFARAFEPFVTFLARVLKILASSCGR